MEYVKLFAYIKKPTKKQGTNKWGDQAKLDDLMQTHATNVKKMEHIEIMNPRPPIPRPTNYEVLDVAATGKIYC